MAIWNMYVGAFTAEFRHLTGAPGHGIERFSFDDASGSLYHVETTTGMTSPQYLSLHPRHPTLYAAEFAAPGRLTSFVIRADGSLEERATIGSLGDRAVAVNVHPRESRAYVANYGSGNVTEVTLDSSGIAQSARLIIPDSQRGFSDSAHSNARPHHIRTTALGDGILVAYAGLDILAAYALEADGTVCSTPLLEIDFPPGSAPRHVEVDPSGNCVYVVGERSSELYVLAARDGVPTGLKTTYRMAPPGYEGKNTPSEIKLHLPTQTLYVGMRGSDQVTALHLDHSGQIEAMEYHSAIGRGPRGLTVDSTGRYLAVANTDSGDMVLFNILDDGGLRPAGQPVPTPSPSSIVFHVATP
jgi:6-phosphogluconolactonase